MNDNTFRLGGIGVAVLGFIILLMGTVVTIVVGLMILKRSELGR